ncbi:Holo-[acyl-carrier-protein] synthase [Buchnera aphidicola (Cinara pseudotaxifoliae)]|uniref:Holo-[acyl-carrier-protein] synthase n=1 Tax=Buchnera aphidicola (Cinara pseudotaxifoliae) TaxID=655384 RepID=A0A451DGV5_9GAMM|nr:holo-ACP synthase [Buchnera aphidicola]VFP85848.1 Holo-[acyl-carrier-protein] synthase [Buchnera aphidicola (Cinara pseudotaxifoliae)]
MAIIGIGIDMVSVKRFKRLIICYGFLIPNKILSKKELIEYKIYNNKEKFLSIRFSAKEAIAKALGIGIYKNMFLKNCEIMHDSYGKLVVRMYGFLKKKIKKLKVKNIFLSITDSFKYTQSIVIIEN